MASRMDESSGNRLKSYKPLFKDIGESRRLREEAGIKLRKDKREKEFEKRRNLQVVEEDSENTNAIFDKETPLNVLAQNLCSDDSKMRHAAVNAVRKALSKKENPPIQEVLEAGILPCVIRMLKEADHQIQFEACWVVTNIASGTSEHTRTIIDNDGVTPLIGMLSSPHEHIQEQAVWALGNIAGDGTEARDYVIGKGIVPALNALLASKLRVKTKQNAAWTVSNLCRGKNPPCNVDDIQPLFNVMKNLLYEEDNEIVIDICWAWSFLADGDNRRIEAVISAGVCPRMTELLLNPDRKILTPALRTLGNLVTGNDEQTQAVINCSVLEVVEPLLTHETDSIRKECCWMLSNIAAGNRAQIQALLDANLLHHILRLMTEDIFKIQKEACWAISNLTVGGTREQIEYLVEREGIPALCQLLNAEDSQVVQVLLEALTNILKIGQVKVRNPGGLNPYCLKIEECGGLEKIESLQGHVNEDVYRCAQRIIEDYFPIDSQEENNPSD